MEEPKVEPVYEIVITKRIPNPNYASELEKRREFDRYNGSRPDMDAPRRELSVNMLSCVLSEKQFNVVKKEALNVFE